MSRFIKSKTEQQAAWTSSKSPASLMEGKISGFTEAERAAAEWARKLEEVRANYMRPTNAEVRTPGRSLGRPDLQVEAKRQRHTTTKHTREPGKLDKEKLEKNNKDKGKKEKKNKKDKKDKTGKKDKKVKKDKKENKVKNDNSGTAETEIQIAEKEKRRLEKAYKRFERKAAKQARLKIRVENVVQTACDNAIDTLISAARFEAARDILSQSSNPVVCDITSGSSSVSAPSSPSSPCRGTGVEEGGLGTTTALPRDPLNPLEEAHNLKAYQELLAPRTRRRRTPEPTDREWDHKPYIMRSPSPCRLRTDGTMAPTRRGAWRSRAGGVYLPPDEDPARASPSQSPARYLYPEDFQKRVIPTRRSPSYNPEPRARSSSSSATTASRRARRAERRARREQRREKRRSRCGSTTSKRSPSRSRTPPPRERSPSYEPVRIHPDEAL